MRDALLCSAVALAFAAGCSSSSSPATNTVTDSGVKADTGTVATDAGTECPVGAAATKLYDRLGCEPGIVAAVSAIATAELGNADIASYFLFAGTPGHPTAPQIEACLVAQLSNASGGPDSYPTTVTTLGTDGGTSSFTCRSMSAAHADLFISGGSFDKFVTIAAGVLAAPPFSVSTADLTTLGAVLNSTKSDIVNPLLDDAGLETFEAGITEADGGQ